MNAGLCNLATLRRHLLAAGSMADERRFDEVLTDLGRGVAAEFDRRCNRRLAYLAGDTITITGNRAHFTLPRYPLVEVTKVETRASDADAWTEDTAQPYRTQAEAGMVFFGGELGGVETQVRLTWTGGYWFETLEPDEDGYPTSAPDPDAIALPADLLHAFLLHCRAVWQSLDKVGADLLRTGSSSQFVTGSIGSLDLSPVVSATLRHYTRYAMS